MGKFDESTTFFETWKNFSGLESRLALVVCLFNDFEGICSSNSRTGQAFKKTGYLILRRKRYSKKPLKS